MLVAHAVRGVKAGVVAGLAFGLLVALVAGPLVAVAEELGHRTDVTAGHHTETGHHGETGGDHGETGGSNAEGVGSGGHSSSVSAVVANGLSVVGGVLWGVLLGGVFGVAYYFLEPAIPGSGATKRYALAAAGFVTVSGAPWLVLPPRPPGVESSLPTETRLVVYGVMMVVGAVVCLLSGFLYGRLRVEHGRPLAATGAASPAAFLVIPAVLSPAGASGSTLPPELATGLTGLVVFGQALLWLLLAGTHARLGSSSAEASVAETGTVPVDASVWGD